MIDPNILLQSRPVSIEPPQQAEEGALSLANLGNQGRLQQQNLQSGALDIQQKQIQLQQQKTINEAYQQALTPGAADGSTSPSIDTGKLTNAIALGGAGSRIPEIIKGVNEFQKSTADLAAAKTKAATDQADYAGGVGATLQKANYDPHLAVTLMQHAQDAGAVDPKVVGPLINEIGQSLVSDPTGASATALTKQLADHFVAQSPAQQKLQTEATAANARAQIAQTGATTAAAALPGVQAASDQKQLQNIATTLAAPKTQADYATALGEIPQKYAQRFPAPAAWTPASSADILKIGMTPDQQVTTAQTAAHNSVEETQGAARVSTEQQNAATNRGRLSVEQQKQGGLGALTPTQATIAQKLASGDFNPAQLARFPDKEAIINGAIAINPAWTPQAFATKDSFTNPEKTQAKNLGTISRIVGHIGRFEQNSQDLGYAPAYALGVNLTGQQNAVNNDAHAISAELEKLTSGGVGSVGQTQEWQKALRSPSAAARQKSIDEISQLIGSQYEGMNQTYKAAIGSDLPIGKFISPAGQAWMRAKGINVGSPAAPAPRAAPAGSVSVTDPAGGVHVFANAADAQTFKTRAGIQ